LEYEVSAGAHGAGDGSQVRLGLLFDQPVAFSEDLKKELRLVIGGNRIKDGACALAQSAPERLDLLISAGAVTSGRLTLAPAEETDRLRRLTSEDGKYAAAAFSIDCLIPSGLTLETLSQIEGSGQEAASVTLRVSSTWTHRGIAWIHLLRDGEIVSPDRAGNAGAAETGAGSEAAAGGGSEAGAGERDGTGDTSAGGSGAGDTSAGGIDGAGDGQEGARAADVMDGAVAVHGHDFRWETEETAARAIAEAINRYYAGRYSALSGGASLTITETGEAGGGGRIALEVYEYRDFSLTGAR
jgi:hypothetical protein